MNDSVSTEEVQALLDGVTGINGDVQKVLADPEQTDRGRDPLVSLEKVKSEQGRDDHLQPAASCYFDEHSQKGEDKMSGFVENQVYVVNEMPFCVG